MPACYEKQEASFLLFKHDKYRRNTQLRKEVKIGKIDTQCYIAQD